jgi:hypothetical protein
MAVTAESLIQPRGPIAPSFFPDDDEPPATEEGSLIARLTTYIERGEDKVAEVGLVSDEDGAVRNWALHLAFSDAYTLMASRPSGETYPTGLGGQSFNSEQLKSFRIEAQKYADEYEVVIAASGAAVGVPSSHATRTTTNKYEW